MLRLKICLAITCSVLIFLACNNQARKTDAILKKAESVMDDRPQDALALLDSISNTKNMDAAQNNLYNLLMVQAKDKNYKDIKGDTAIFRVKEYYINNNTIDKGALASFYAGRVLREMGDHENAMLAFLDAETHSKELDDENLKGMIQFQIGALYYKDMSNNQAAIARYRDAERIFRTIGNYKSEIASLNMLGGCFLINNENDSAFYYYDKGIELANKYNDVVEQMNIRQNMGIAFLNVKDMENAKQYLNLALQYASDKSKQAQVYLNLARVFIAESERDSAIYYTNKSLELINHEKNNSLSLTAHNLLTAIEYGNGDYEKALEYCMEYIKILKSHFKDREDQRLLEIQNKYDYEQIQNINNQLTIEKQWILLIGLFVVVCALIVLLYYYRKLGVSEKKLLEAGQKIDLFTEMVQGNKETNNMLKKALYLQFDIQKKAALLEGYLREDERKQGEKLLKKFNEIVYGQENLDWSKLYQSMNEVQDGFFDKMRKKYPELDESEFKICWLSYADFSNTEISIIMKQSINTIQTKKSAIRKKIGVKEYGNLVEFLDENVK